MQQVLSNYKNLTINTYGVEDLIIKDNEVQGFILADGTQIQCKSCNYHWNLVNGVIHIVE
jgi:tRNA U34 5-carboxymethylaminomethyl modifying enzyme MnmG/GidA